jgi:hypothetical protein
VGAWDSSSLSFRRILVVAVWFPYLRWFLLVIFNLPTTIAVRAVLAIIYPATAITMWTNLHCQLLSIEPSSAGCALADSQPSSQLQLISLLSRREGWSSASNGTIRPSTAVGLIWRNPNSASSPSNASTAAFPISKPLRRNRRMGARAQWPTRQVRLALHHQRRSH